MFETSGGKRPKIMSNERPESLATKAGNESREIRVPLENVYSREQNLPTRNPKITQGILYSRISRNLSEAIENYSGNINSYTCKM